MESEPDYVIITTGIPVAYAGEDQEVKVGEDVYIFSWQSQPYPGGADITGYHWSLLQKPGEFDIDLPDSFSDKKYILFTAKHVGIYIFRLNVIDADDVVGVPDIVKITVTNERSNPLSMDTDDDGVSDGHEYHIYGTRLNDRDTDNDGLMDGQELGYTVNDVTRDTDMSKFKADADAGATTTNPTFNDTDGDGLCDGFEDKNWNLILDTGEREGEDYNQNGKFEKFGTDGIPLNDDDETDPNDEDTDGDQLWDGTDIDVNNDNIIDPEVDHLGELSSHTVSSMTIRHHTWGIVFSGDIYEFLPTLQLDSDSDHDGLSDSTEIFGTTLIYEMTDKEIDISGCHYGSGYACITQNGDELYLERTIYSDPNEEDSEDLGISVRGDGVLDSIEYEKGTDPMSDDTDEDGLKDGFEMVLSANPYRDNFQDNLNLWMSFPWDYKPNPLRKDIYVEVDWMRNSIEEQAIVEFHLGPNFNYNYHWFSQEGKSEIINAFNNARVYNPDGLKGINFNIDDGTGGWTGGTSIPHDDFVTEAEQDDIIDSYFNPSRENIFYYSLIAHLEPDNDPDDRLSSTQSAGESGNPFTVFDANVRSSLGQAKVFMHELGHNLGLNGGSNRYTVMHEPAEGAKVIDYTSYEWTDITINP